MNEIITMFCNVVTRELVIYIREKDDSIVMVRLPWRIHKHIFT